MSEDCRRTRSDQNVSIYVVVLKKIVSMKPLSLLFFVCISILMACGDSKPQQQKDLKKESTSDQVMKEERVAKKGEQIVLFFGNSLSAGYGLDEGQSFPDRIQETIDSLDLGYTVVNAGNSGETTAGGAGRIDWVLNQDIDIFILELGGNDLLRGIDVANTESNLRAIIDKVKAKSSDIQIILAGMQAPPNMGDDYTREFAAIYPRLAKEYQIGLIPFLLDKVGGNPKLNQSDGIHPSVEGAKIVAETVWETLKGYLN